MSVLEMLQRIAKPNLRLGITFLAITIGYLVGDGYVARYLHPTDTTMNIVAVFTLLFGLLAWHYIAPFQRVSEK
jgi:hypothetical protein